MEPPRCHFRNDRGLRCSGAAGHAEEHNYPTVTCPICEQEVAFLVVDAPGTIREAAMCEDCQRCTEIMAADVRFLVKPQYNFLTPDESMAEYMRRMHQLLLPTDGTST